MMDRPDPYGPLAGAVRSALDRRDGEGTAERRDEMAKRERAREAAERDWVIEQCAKVALEDYPVQARPDGYSPGIKAAIAERIRALKGKPAAPMPETDFHREPDY